MYAVLLITQFYCSAIYLQVSLLVGQFTCRTVYLQDSLLVGQFTCRTVYLQDSLLAGQFTCNVQESFIVCKFSCRTIHLQDSILVGHFTCMTLYFNMHFWYILRSTVYLSDILFSSPLYFTMKQKLLSDILFLCSSFVVQFGTGPSL